MGATYRAVASWGGDGPSPMKESLPLLLPPFWRRPTFVCLVVGIIAGAGMELLYQKSGYSSYIQSFGS